MLSLFYLIFSIQFLLKSLKAAHFDSATNTIYDLEYQDSAFVAETNSWFQSSYKSSGVKTSTCDGNTLLGGYNVLGGSSQKGQYWEKTYTGLPMPHNVLYFTIRIYPLDSWDYGDDDHFEIWFGSIKIIAWTLEGYDSPYAPLNICGGSYKDLKYMYMYATVPHSTSSVTVRVVSSLNNPSDDESLGFREIQMQFQQVSSPPGGASFCGVTQGNPLDSNVCPCPAGKYMTPANSGNCANCDGTCLTCSAGGASACVTCPDGRWKSGSTCPACNSNCQTCGGSATTCLSCPAATPYMIGTTCYPTCDPPLEQDVVGSVTFCKSPCSAGVPVWWDKSCGTCFYTDTYGEVFSMQQVTVNTFPQCKYPCTGTQVLYYNTSCLNTCPGPLTTLTYRSRSFCAYSCTPTASQYLYWNGSCSDTCPWPLSYETQAPATAYARRFCWYYCQPGEYMYWNGSCISTCPWPLSPEIQGTDPAYQRKFCWYPCTINQHLYWNGSCLDSCLWPLSYESQGSTAFPRRFCWYHCDPDYFLYWNGTCLPSCPWPLSPETQGTDPAYQRKFCWFNCTTDQYLYWNGSCIDFCNWPLVFETQGLGSGFPRKFCWYRCQPDEFLYWNGSCISTCDWPLSPETQGTDIIFQRKFCWYPCTVDQYLYWNGSCLDNCLWPLSYESQGSTAFPRSFCWYRCQPDEFLYWNQSCLSSCPSPLTPETRGTNPASQRKFCLFSCTVDQYLYWNGSCLDDCWRPLSPDIQAAATAFPRSFCWYPCDANHFLYWNGSCLPSCPLPLSFETQGTDPTTQRKFCLYTCDPSQYLYWNGSCLSSCRWPLSPETQGTTFTYQRNFCWFSCQPGEYMYWNGTCSSACGWPLIPETQGTNPLYLRKFCWYLCQPNDFLYWNGSCLNTCPWPLSPETQGTNPLYQRKFCWYTCQPSEFLYWNGSCFSTCPTPLSGETQGTIPTYKRNFCWYTCQPNEYLYSDKSCLATCDPPLSPETQGTNPTYQRKFCWSKSSCPSGQFKLSDGSCVGSCPSGYFGSTTLYTCEPCQDSLCSVCTTSLGAKCQVCKGQNILDSSGVCKDCQALNNEFIKQNDEIYTYQYKLKLLPVTCDLDEAAVRQYLQPTTDSKILFPSFSFQVSQLRDSAGAKYFLLEIQFDSPISSENSLIFVLGPLQTGLQVAMTPVQTPQPTTPGADPGVKTTFAAVTGSTVGAGLTLGATAALWSIISFQQFVGYFIYLNVKLPPHLIYFLTMFDNVNLEILPNPLARITDRLAELWNSLVNNNDLKYQLPHKFADFKTPTLFIINAGSTFFVCIVLLLVPYILDLLRKFKSIKRIRFLQTLHSNFRWNIPIRIFLESGIPLTFALLIQMRKISYSNVPYIISAVTAGLTFVYLYFMISYISKTLANFKHEDLKDPSVENSIGTLFEGLVMKKEKPLGKYYYALILFRGMLLVFVCVFAEQYPVVQTTTMVAFNLFFVYYVWRIIQFESRYLNWTNRIKEVLILIVEIFFTTLCFLEKEQYRNIVGWLTIGMLGLTLSMELLFGFYLQMLAVKNLVKRVREHCKKRKKALVIAPVSTEDTFRNILTIETEK